MTTETARTASSEETASELRAMVRVRFAAADDTEVMFIDTTFRKEVARIVHQVWAPFGPCEVEQLEAGVYPWLHTLLFDRDLLVCCLNEDPSVVLGFLIGRRTPAGVVIDFAFTKSRWRSQGVQTILLEALGWDATKPTLLTLSNAAARAWRRRRPKSRIIFDPTVLVASAIRYEQAEKNRLASQARHEETPHE